MLVWLINLSILFMRFEDMSGEEKLKITIAFNSLYEILLKEQYSRTSWRTCLSILFMRFTEERVAALVSQQIALSILFMRFPAQILAYFLYLLPAHFQFSL